MRACRTRRFPSMRAIVVAALAAALAGAGTMLATHRCLSFQRKHSDDTKPTDARHQIISANRTLSDARDDNGIDIVRLISWAPKHKGREQRFYRTEEEISYAWAADGGRSEEMPKVDFEREMVIAVFAGEMFKSRAGEPEILKIVSLLPKRDEICVLYEYLSAERASTSAERVYPATAVVINKSELNIRFVDVNSPKFSAPKL